MDITCRSALNKLKRKVPYGWDLNIYRGCIHNCIYCYARHTHEYLGNNDFSEVCAKTNIVEQLERELGSTQWKREVINIGGVTDSYQSIEEKMRLMPQILKLLIRYRTPAIISTKSDLILRDYDLIAQLAEITYVNIASTVITLDEKVRSRIEPVAVSGQRRFAMLKEFRKTNASVGLHTMPIIPLITDGIDNIENLCSEANKANVHYMLPGVLYLRGVTRKVFFNFIEKEYPEKLHELRSIYKTGGADKAYKEKLYTDIVNPLRKKYDISGSYINPMKERLNRNE